MLVITANTLRQQLTNTEGKDWGLGLNGSQNSLLLLTFTYPLLFVSYALLLKF